MLRVACCCFTQARIFCFARTVLTILIQSRLGVCFWVVMISIVSPLWIW